MTINHCRGFCLRKIQREGHKSGEACNHEKAACFSKTTILRGMHPFGQILKALRAKAKTKKTAKPHLGRSSPKSPRPLAPSGPLVCGFEKNLPYDLSRRVLPHLFEKLPLSPGF
jgi:hypothetical protein